MAETAEERARAIAQRVLYLTLATSTVHGEPWNSPVYCSFDNDWRFYWASDPHSQHSQNLAASQQLFGVVYDSTAPAGTGDGLYMRATAEQLVDPADVRLAREVLLSRIQVAQDGPDDFTASPAVRCYRAIPSAVWINGTVDDEDGHYVKDCRVELPLETLTGLVTW